MLLKVGPTHAEKPNIHKLEKVQFTLLIISDISYF